MDYQLCVFSQDNRVRDFFRKCSIVDRVTLLCSFEKLQSHVNRCFFSLVFLDVTVLCRCSQEEKLLLVSILHRIPVVLIVLEDKFVLPRSLLFQHFQGYLHLPCDFDCIESVLYRSFCNRRSFVPDDDSFDDGNFESAELKTILGNSPEIVCLKRIISRLAETDAPVLLCGESGTGKTYIARIIHTLSKRKLNPFCSLNMAAVPVMLAESELFGTVRGAYTDAVNRNGYITQAERGSLFLDEIGEMPLDMQPKLLHVIESGLYSKVGAPKEYQADVRFIFATNADLQQKVERKEFRSDLFYRVAAFPVYIPALRDRKSDIPQLVTHFLGENNCVLSPTGMQKLMDYHWPGNIRELKNCLLRARILSGQEVIQDKYILF